MKFFLTGGTGFIGRHLVLALTARGDTCTIVSRSRMDPFRLPGVRIVTGDPKAPGAWQREIDGTDGVINLAGEVIVKPPLRWTAARKAVLRSSRIDVTRNVVAAMRSASRPPAALLNSSGVHHYGDRGEQVLDEQATRGDGFLPDLVVDWERAALEAEPATRVTLLRTGIVLGPDGGALPSLLPPFKAGLGGPLGTGRQWWSWVHVMDVVGIALYALEREMRGPINVVAPGIVRMGEFASALGRAVKRPAVLPVPAFVLRLALGEAALPLLDSTRAVPRRALDAGYAFRFPDVDSALRDALDTRKKLSPRR